MKRKNFVRSTIMFIALVMMFSVMSMPAFAAGSPMPYSNTDIQFYRTAPLAGSSFSQIPTGDKDNDKPAWLRIDTMTNQEKVRVRVVGSKVKNHACTYNDYNTGPSIYHCDYCTRCTTKGNWVPFVLCRKTTNYAISSIVFESGYPYSSLGFQSTSTDVTQYVDGWWSADSTNYANYAQPEVG